MTLDDALNSSVVGDDYFALLPRTPLLGPSASCMNARGLDLHRGTLMQPPKDVLRYELRVEPEATNPLTVLPLDLHEAERGHLLMSERMVRCLENAGITNIQFFPGEAIYLPTRAVLPYQVGNIVGLVRALDESAAECVTDEDGMVETFNGLRIDRRRVAGLELFRMYESFHTIIVSRRIREALESHHITGVWFMGEADWEPGTI